MAEHPVIGERILRGIGGFATGADIVRHEHEAWDGSGYPDGLAGDAIPIGSRIILACDAYHAMTSDRPYRKAMSDEEARRRLREGAGTQFDPQVVWAALPVLPGTDESIPLELPGLSEAASNGHKNGTGSAITKASEGLQTSFIEQIA